MKIIGKKYHFHFLHNDMTKQNSNARIYSRTGDKWHNTVVMPLIGYMTSPGLYERPYSTMEAMQKFPHARLAQ